MMGTGAVSCNTPHTALPATSLVREPLSRPVKVVWTRSSTSTWMKELAPGKHGGGELAQERTPGTEPGKLTRTSLEGRPVKRPVPL